jgi:hypothetical protein
MTGRPGEEAKGNLETPEYGVVVVCAAGEVIAQDRVEGLVIEYA